MSSKLGLISETSVSGVSSCAGQPNHAKKGMNEVVSVESIADLKTSYSITGPSCRQTSSFLIRKKRLVGLKKIINGDFRRNIFIQEEAAQKETRFLTGRQVAWMMIYEYVKVSDTDESVMDLNEIW